MMLSMVKIGEESGSLESMLVKTSDYYEEELETAIKQLLSLLEPAMIIVMGGYHRWYRSVCHAANV